MNNPPPTTVSTNAYPMKSAIALLTYLAISVSAFAGEWIPLFDGKSLDGWKTNKNEAPGKGWSVVDGILQLDGRGGDILSPDEYSNFELIWTWKISPKGNNGVKYWVTTIDKALLGPEYQMIDDKGHPDALIGKKRSTACLYDIKPADADKPLKPVGEWNESRVIANNGTIEHHLNGKLVCKIDTQSDEWKTLIAASKFRNKAGYASGKGRIMLTDHGDKTWYKEIKIRHLEAPKN